MNVQSLFLRRFSPRGSTIRSMLLLLFGLAIAASVQAEESSSSDEEWTALYKGTLDDFRIYFRGQGYIDVADEQEVFIAEPGQIHVVQGTNGLIVTKAPYRRYHVKVDYRWGAEAGSRNAGLMTHVDLESKRIKDNRPRSVEINMYHSHPGSIWLAKGLGPFASTFVEEDTRTYLPEESGGILHDASPFDDRTIYARYPDEEANTQPWGEWNTLEAIVRGSESVEIIHNGRTVNRIYDLRAPAKASEKPGAPADVGGIGLQSEGQEIFYRNFVIKELEL